MAKLHARSGHGTRYASKPVPRVLGSCQETDCPGDLIVGIADDETVIACTLCPAVWPRLRWVELSELLERAVA